MLLETCCCFSTFVSSFASGGRDIQICLISIIDFTYKGSLFWQSNLKLTHQNHYLDLNLKSVRIEDAAEFLRALKGTCNNLAEGFLAVESLVG